MRDELRPIAVFALRRFRRTTSPLRLLPAFLIIGTQPAAAVPLFNALRRHPDIVGPSAAHENATWSRELHFFDQSFSRGVNWYRSCFPLSVRRSWARRRGGDLLAAEATASYLSHPEVPDRVADTIPDVRLIALLRDPIERAYWHYEAMRRKGQENLTFEEALEAEGERTAAEDARRAADRRPLRPPYQPYAYMGKGLYADQLERWLARFSREQLLALPAEDFVTRPEPAYATVLDFLGLRAWQPRNIQVPEWPPAPIEPALRSALEDRFAESNRRLADLLGRDFAWGSGAESFSASEIRHGG